MLTKSQGKTLLRIARGAIEEALLQKTVYVPHAIRKLKIFSQQPGIFVTLLKNNELRGSMGYPPGVCALIDGVIDCARDAAFKDPRFKAVTKGELKQLRVRIDVLSKFKKSSVKGLKPEKHGVSVEYGPFKALQLPEDAKKFGWTAREMVRNALRKAGLASEMWNDRHIKIYSFTVKRLEEV